MDVLKSMRVYVEVARQGSFAPAARALGLSTTSVSRQVVDLESWLGVTLIHRTTRALSLSEEGAFYLKECERVLDDVAQIKTSANDALKQPRGTLRLTAPVFVIKECVQNLLPGFLDSFPELQVELSALDRFVDLVDEGFDLALRIGELPDSSLIARKLGDVPLVAVGSPEYLAKRGAPTDAADLKTHNCIVDTVASFSNRWPITRGGTRKGITVSGNIVVNNGEIARNLAEQDVGLALLPEFFVRNQLAQGTLISVLEGQVDSQVGFFAVYPQNRHLTPKVRAFIDYVVDYMDRIGVR